MFVNGSVHNCAPNSLLAQRNLGRSKKADSIKEIDLLKWIRNADLPLPVPQARVIIDKHTTHKPDFAYLDRKIAIEVQSWKWHGGPVKQREDALKVLRMTALGWTVISVIAHPDHKSTLLRALTNALNRAA